MRAPVSRSNTPLFRLFSLVACLFLLLAAGCSTQSGTQGSSLRSEDGTVRKPLQDKESGESLDNLKTFRGLFSARKGGGVLTLCGSGNELKVQDRTEGGLEAVVREFAPSPGDVFFVELLGRRVVRPPHDRTQGAFPVPPEVQLTDAVVFEAIHASFVMESLGCREQYSTFSFKARGNEPGWMVLAEPGRMSFNAMDLAQPFLFRNVERTGDDDNAEYRADGMTLTVTRGWCRDTMSGELFGWTAEAEVDGTVYRGCAVRGDL
ncbi:COG3650 family protein [Pseudodesulfovibrio indicus]|uniref:Membrane protein n=1 Tax=Pseudodesulfovibrio indicus TaxID=1716143 RepID=A0AA94PLW8_9BACT|nr:hypothetical protein [Pseudodesulfovibrio indicus]TDT87139.1 putative membrane protein [Pseudodesulfovibrio indicus]